MTVSGSGSRVLSGCFFQSLGSSFNSHGFGFVLPIRIRIQEIQLNTDPDLGCKINTYSHGSGSETLVFFLHFSGESFSSNGFGSLLPIRIRIQEIQLNTDLDPGCKTNKYPHGSISKTLINFLYCCSYIYTYLSYLVMAGKNGFYLL